MPTSLSSVNPGTEFPDPENAAGVLNTLVQLHQHSHCLLLCVMGTAQPRDDIRAFLSVPITMMERSFSGF
jgi:hypothetical protein